jgi:hypothetical protein
MKIVTGMAAGEISSGAAAATPPLANGSRATVQERSWVVSEAAGRAMLTRKHPLTLEGEEIGSFDLTFGCGEPGKDVAVTYFEQRRSAGRRPEVLTEVEISLSGKSVPLAIVSSQPGSRSLESDSVARGRVPADLLKGFADPRSRSLLIETTSDSRATSIRIGNAGVARAFQQFAATCGGPPAIRSTARTDLRREAGVQPR